MDMHNWILENLDVSKHSLAEITEFACIIWRLWVERFTLTREQLQTYAKPARSLAPIYLVLWKPPMEGRVKLNTDGANKGNPGIAAESFAIRIGRALAWKYGFCNVVCEVDAQVVLQLSESGNASTHPLGVIVDDIRILHTFREGNFCDSLSKMGCDLEEDLAVFNSPPAEVASSLAADSRGVSFPRDFNLL
ncbi:hypothetical protein F3Y22_tig00110890pilonHSYRG01692 [Hibiscus syriacus]|uniref:RNase H type-1 domain-containing protein n=1 Tax=Hibiscus syriacus TaxID=106335 RepID=A0A6A2ZIM3_HIBSY|nr:hypothetical protein F3Y22_tig00110890pilonHSYRG01692 [Hibiscus syriacus]